MGKKDGQRTRQNGQGLTQANSKYTIIEALSASMHTNTQTYIPDAAKEMLENPNIP
jgi:hypothetical protein